MSKKDIQQAEREKIHALVLEKEPIAEQIIMSNMDINGLVYGYTIIPGGRKDETGWHAAEDIRLDFIAIEKGLQPDIKQLNLIMEGIAQTTGFGLWRHQIIENSPIIQYFFSPFYKKKN